MHTSETCPSGKQQISHHESERKRERERGGGRREGERDALTIFKHVFVLSCVNTEAIADEGEKEEKRQHKYDALQK